MQTAIARAVILLRSSPEIDDKELQRALGDARMDRNLAECLVEPRPDGVLQCDTQAPRLP